CTLYFVFLIILRPTRSTLFPYTTLFRSAPQDRCHAPAAPGIPLYTPEHVAPGAREHREHQAAVRAARACGRPWLAAGPGRGHRQDRKSTRLNSSHVKISYAVFCLKKKKK